MKPDSQLYLNALFLNSTVFFVYCVFLLLHYLSLLGLHSNLICEHCFRNLYHWLLAFKAFFCTVVSVLICVNLKPLRWSRSRSAPVFCSHFVFCLFHALFDCTLKTNFLIPAPTEIRA